MADDDRDLIERYLAWKLGKPLTKAKHGELMDVYRAIGLQFGVAESSPRMWRVRGRITKHIRRQILAELNEETQPLLAMESLQFDPVVMEIARDVQKLYELTRGRGEFWRSLEHTVAILLTMAKRGRLPKAMRHMRPLPRG